MSASLSGSLLGEPLTVRVVNANGGACAAAGRVPLVDDQPQGVARAWTMAPIWAQRMSKVI